MTNRTLEDQYYASAWVKPPPDELFGFCKIVSIGEGGALQLEVENLSKILDRDKTYGEMPVAAVGTIGILNREKEFVTSLQINCRKLHCVKDWLIDMTNEINEYKMDGFCWGDGKGNSPSTNIFKPTATQEATSGIYIWPQPFVAEFVNDNKDSDYMLLWYLNLFPGVQCRDEEMRSLERLLMLICSRLTEVAAKGQQDFRVVKELLNVPPRSYKFNYFEFCDSINFLFIDKKQGYFLDSTAGADAQKDLIELMTTNCDPQLKATHQSDLIRKSFKNLNLITVQPMTDKISLQNGRLVLDNRFMEENLKKVVCIIGDTAQIRPKKYLNTQEYVYLDNFSHFLDYAVKAVEYWNGIKTESTTATTAIKPLYSNMSSFPSTTTLTTYVPIPAYIVKSSSSSSSSSSKGLHKKSKRSKLSENVQQEKIKKERKDKNAIYVTMMEENDDHGTTLASSSSLIQSSALQDPNQNSAPEDIQSLIQSSEEQEQFAEPPSESIPLPSPQSSSSFQSQQQNQDDDHNQSSPQMPAQSEEEQEQLGEQSPSPKIQQPPLSLPLTSSSSQPHQHVAVQSSIPPAQAQAASSQLPQHLAQYDQQSPSSSQSEQPDKDAEQPLLPMIMPPQSLASFQSKQQDQQDHDDHKQCSAHMPPESEQLEQVAQQHPLLPSSQIPTSSSLPDTSSPSSSSQQPPLPPPSQGEKQKEKVVVQLSNPAYKFHDMLRKTLILNVERWLSSTLSLENVQDLLTQLNAILHNSSIHACGIIDAECGTNWRQEDHLMLQTFINMNAALLCRVIVRLDMYYNGMKTTLENLHCLNKIQMTTADTVEYNRANNNSQVNKNPDIEKEDKSLLSLFVAVGCRRLCNLFIEMNENFIKKEELDSSKVILKVIAYYTQDMEQHFLKNEVETYPPEKLEEIHAKVVKELIALFQTKFDDCPQKSTCQNFHNIVTKLKLQLDKELRGYYTYTKTEAKEKKLQHEINYAKLHIMKEVFENEMTILLKKENEDILLNFQNLLLHFADIVQYTIDCFKIYYQKISKKTEPNEQHIKDIRNQTTEYWTTVIIPAIQKKRQEKTTAHVGNQHKKKENKHHNQANKKLQHTLLASTSKVSIPPVTTTTTTTTLSVSSTESTKEDDAPMLFHLQSECLTVGCRQKNGKVKLIFPSKPLIGLVVGQSKEGKLVFGKDQCGKPNIKTTWDVAAILKLHGRSIWRDKITLKNGRTCEITLELLLACTVQYYKTLMEKQLKMNSTTAIVCVPIWYSSLQRIIVKHAVILAGFVHVYVLNDTSAAVYVMTHATKSPENVTSTVMKNILVISESAGIIDATIYAWSIQQSTFTMIAHSGFEVPKGFEDIETPNTNVETSPKAKVIKVVCEQALKQIQITLDPANLLSASRTTIYRVILCVENSKKWMKTMKVVANLYSRKIEPIDTIPVIYGAAYLSQQKQALKNNEILQDRLAFPLISYVEDAEKSVSVFNENYNLSVSCQTITSIFVPAKNRGIRFFQHIHDWNHYVGILTVSQNIPSTLYVRVRVDITNEGICTLKDVCVSNWLEGRWEYLHEKLWRWDTEFVVNNSEDMEKLRLVLTEVISLCNTNI